MRSYCQKIGANVVGFTDPSLCLQFSPDSHPESFLPDVLTILTVGIHLFDLILDAWTRSVNDAGHNYQYADQILESMCYRVKQFLADRGFSAELIPYGGLFLKEIGALAGLGPIGKNNLLLTEQFGPQIRLRALATNAPLDCGTPIFESPYCENCQCCIDACPANALEGGTYDLEKCELYQLDHLEKLSPCTAIWCNKCIEACPVGQKP